MCYHDDQADDSSDSTIVTDDTTFTLKAGDEPIDVRIRQSTLRVQGATPLLIEFRNRAARYLDEDGSPKTYSVSPLDDARSGDLPDGETLNRAKAFAEAFVASYAEPLTTQEKIYLSLGLGSRKVSALCETHQAAEVSV